MARREGKKPEQPPFILLDHNIQAQTAEQLSGLARFRRVGEREQERRFQSAAKDTEIYQGASRFLFVTHDQGFLLPGRLPNEHGGVLVFVCSPGRLAAVLRRFLEWGGPRRDYLRNRVFRLTATGGVEVLRDGTLQPIFRQPAESDQSSYS